MKIFQMAYDSIKRWQAPSWVKILMQELNDAIVSIAIGVGQDFIQKAKIQIISLAKSDMTNSEKISEFKKWALRESPEMKDQVINLLRELLYAKVKIEF